MTFLKYLTIGALLLMPRIISRDGLELLKKHEGYSPVIYKDQAGKDTIGYGHLILPGEDFRHGLTRAQALELLKKDVKVAQNGVNQHVDVPLTKNQFDALTSFAYNVGVNAFANSTLLAKLNQGDYEGAANELLRWNKITIDGDKQIHPHLTKRRNDERQLFLS